MGFGEGFGCGGKGGILGARGCGKDVEEERLEKGFGERCEGGGL